MQMEGEGGREEGEREMCCLEEIHSAEEKRQTACRRIVWERKEFGSGLPPG